MIFSDADRKSLMNAIMDAQVEEFAAKIDIESQFQSVIAKIGQTQAVSLTRNPDALLKAHLALTEDADTAQTTDPSRSAFSLAEDISAPFAMAAGTATTSDQAEENWLKLDVDATTSTMVWQDQEAASFWEKANCGIQIESDSTSSRFRLVLLNADTLPRTWRFSAVGLHLGQEPGRDPPVEIAASEGPNIPITLALGCRASDFGSACLYISVYGIATLGRLRFSVKKS